MKGHIVQIQICISSDFQLEIKNEYEMKSKTFWIYLGYVAIHLENIQQ